LNRAARTAPVPTIIATPTHHSVKETTMNHLPFAALLALGLHLAPAEAAWPADSACVHPLATSTAALQSAAQQAFRARHYAAAYGRFVRLADAGHAPSAETALFMLQNGPTLFATEWSASAPQQTCWNTLAVARGRMRFALNSDRGTN
jgi:hypothetical protein